jgi:hypothetical protein
MIQRYVVKYRQSSQHTTYRVGHTHPIRDPQMGVKKGSVNNTMTIPVSVMLQQSDRSSSVNKVSAANVCIPVGFFFSPRKKKKKKKRKMLVCKKTTR